MNRKTIYKFSFILLIGFIVKMLGLLNRVIMARVLGIDGVSLYALVMPTMALFLTLSQFGLPIAVSKIVSENKTKPTYSNRNIILKSFFFSVILSIVLIIVFLCILKPLTHNWLKNDDLFYPLLMIIPLIPLCSFSSILKGYLNGHKIIDVTSKSQLFEQIIRISVAIGLIYATKDYGIVASVCAGVIAISIGELAALLYLLMKISKMTKLNFSFKKTDEKEFMKILDISMPITASRIFSSVSNFLEPIIFTAALMSLGVKKDMIARLFGSITSYALNLLLFLSFLTYTISAILIPQISELYIKNDRKKIEVIIKIANFFCFFCAGLSTVILMLFPYDFMKLIYGSDTGAKFVVYMAPFFFIFYFQSVFVSVLQSANKSNHLLIVNIISNVLKLFLIYFLTIIPGLNANGLAIAIIFSVIFNTVFYYLLLRKEKLFSLNIKDFLSGIIFLVLLYLFGFQISKVINNYLLTSGIIFIIFFSLFLVFYHIRIKKLFNLLRNP